MLLQAALAYVIHSTVASAHAVVEIEANTFSVAITRVRFVFAFALTLLAVDRALLAFLAFLVVVRKAASSKAVCVRPSHVAAYFVTLRTFAGYCLDGRGDASSVAADGA